MTETNPSDDVLRELGQKARIGHVRKALDTTTGSDGLWWTDGHVWVFMPLAPFEIKVVSDTETVTTGDGKIIFEIGPDLDGTNLVFVRAFVTTVSSSGTPTVQIRNVTQAADMLSTPITINVSQKSSRTASIAAVIDTANDDVADGDQIAVDVDVAGTGARGLGVILRFA